MYYTRRQLQLFLAVADHGGVSAAARACHVTQPTVSMQLKELAESVGMPLFEPVGRTVRLTEAGKVLAATARAMNQEWERFEQQVAAMKGLTTGRLCISTVSTAKYFVPRILGHFCKQYAGIDVSLSVQNRDGILARLRDNIDDLYVMSQPPTDLALDVIPFLANPLVMIAPQNHPLARRKRIQLQTLKTEPFILREPGSGTRLAVEAHFRDKEFSPRVRWELGSNEAVKQAVEGEMGLGVLSEHALLASHSEQQPVILNVVGFPLPSRWYIVSLRAKPLSPIAQAFLTYLREEAHQLEQHLHV